MAAGANLSLRAGQIGLISLLLLLPATCRAGNSDEPLFESYEKMVNEAVRSWITNNYREALNQLYQAGDYLSAHMVSPRETGAWQAWSALKMYTKLLTVMVRFDQSESQMDERDRLAKEMALWIDRLNEQTRVWRSMILDKSSDILFRNRWVPRLEAALKKARKVLGIRNPQNSQDRIKVPLT